MCNSYAARVGLSLAATAVTMLLSIFPGEPEEGDWEFVFILAEVPSAFQNSMHFVVYGTLAVLWSWAFDRGHRRLAYAVAGVVAYGIALEVVQLAVPGRFSSILDIALNTAGATLAALILIFWRRWRNGEARKLGE